MTGAHDTPDLDALVSVIESLQERIKRDHDTIGADETRTRTALIDPLLSALGWDTANPAMVIPEYRIGNMKVDYALLKVPKDRRKPQPVVLVEAKRMIEYLGDHRRGDHRRQLFNYAYTAGVKYGCLTNGARWVLYDVFNRDAPRNDRRILDVSFRHESAFDCAVQLLPLKRSNLETGETLSAQDAQRLLWEVLENDASPAVVKLLLDHGADVAARDNDGKTPLHAAVEGDAEQAVVKMLLDRGADIAATDAADWTPLHYAAAPSAVCVSPFCGLAIHPSMHLCPHCRALQYTYCVECLRDVRLANITPSGTCADCAGIEEAERVAVIALLLGRGADIEAVDNVGCDPYQIAKAMGSSRDIRWSLRKPDQNFLDEDFWRYASVADVRTQLHWRASVSATPNAGFVLLHFAAGYNPNPKTIELLLDRGADIAATDDRGLTPLHHAAKLNPQPAVIEMLLSRGADFTATDNEGRMPLHLAAGWNVEPAVTKLLLLGDANTTATPSWTSRLASWSLPVATKLLAQGEANAVASPPWNSKLARWLLMRKGADINVRDNRGLTPLHLASCFNLNPDVLALLLNRGADIEVTDNFGSTPLHLAAELSSRPDVIKMLLANGSDMAALRGDRRTAHRIAEERGASEEILRLLRG